MKNEFEKDLEINPHQLELEWIRQPQLASKYNHLSKEASKDHRYAKERKKTVRSRLMLGAVVALKEQGQPTSDAMKEAYYRSHPDYIAAVEEEIEAEVVASKLQDAVYIIGQRKAALEDLVRLLGMDYFAKPNTPREIGESWREKTYQAEEAEKDSVDDRIKERTNRRTSSDEEETTRRSSRRRA